MRIQYDDGSTRVIQIDRAGLRAFLVEQGMTREQLHTLTIRFGVRRKVNDCTVNGHKLPPQRIGGLHSGNTINLYTHGKLNSLWLNHVLLHELRHHMQTKWTHEQGYHFAIDDNVIKYDDTIPYSRQPWEIDANRFATQHQDKQFLSLPYALGKHVVLPAQPKKPAFTGPMKWIAIGLGGGVVGIAHLLRRKQIA